MLNVFPKLPFVDSQCMPLYVLQNQPSLQTSTPLQNGCRQLQSPVVAYI